MKIKTKISELSGIALDWLVAKCEGKVEQGVYGTPKLLENGLHLHYCDVLLSHPYSPSTDWAEGGPIIEREKISTAYEPSMIYDDTCRWKAISAISDNEHFYGPTLMIAAMRCYVSAKLGDKVEIPDELLP